ncbi:uncharacterized protein LOC133202231 [Saccostrea echinata]|uniref:uncharacterized protein LOC133202231 n=1 Tax=Saccostrea echinata TaxID=191078 RepID=UPI002A80FC2E|nr:uncharacterized protein LOC133202231 [Saccostrea echinata]
MFHLKFLLFVGFCCAVFGNDGNQTGRNQPPSKGTDCIRRITTQVARYFWKLQSRRIDYRERNNRVFADIPFLHLTTIYGWTMRGKQGRISQAREDGRGIITEYMIQYLNSDGNWTYINNSKTGKQIFANLGNIAIPDTITSVTLANPVTTLVLRVIPELWDGVPFMMMSIQHCADTDIAEKNPILPLQLAHNSVKKNLEDQMKKKIQQKIFRLQHKVKLMKHKMAQKQHHNNKVQTIHRGGQTGKAKSFENHRTNHRKQYSNKKHRKLNRKQSKQKGNHRAEHKHPKTNVQQTKERRNTRKNTQYGMVDYHRYGLDDSDERLKREQKNEAKNKDTNKDKVQSSKHRQNGKQTKKPESKSAERKHSKNDQHGKNNEKKSHNKVAPKQSLSPKTKQQNKSETSHNNKKHKSEHKPKVTSAKKAKNQKPKGKDKGKNSHQKNSKKSKKIDRLSKKIDRTVKKLNQLKKEINDMDKKPPKKVSNKVKVSKPQTSTPEVTGKNPVKTEAESLSPAKNKPSLKSAAMKQIKKQDDVITKTAYESCRLMPVWRYGSTNFRPDDSFSALADNRQAWRAMYGLGIQPYRFGIPERYQKSRNQKYYLEIDFKKITNIFGLKVAGSSSQMQWGIITRFSLYHRRKESDPWQGYVDHLNQHRVFEIGSREKGNAHAPSVFKLDVPVTAKAIRIYPERWVSAPLMVVDLLTCETSYKH